MASRVLYSLLDVPEGDKPQSPDNRIRWLNEQQGKLMKERMDVFGHSDPTKDMEHRAVAAMVRRKAIGHHNARKNASERYLRKQIFSLKDSNKDRKSKSVAHISRNSSDLLNQNFNSKAEVQADALVAWEDCRNTCPALMSVANHHVVSSQTRSRSRVSSATQNLHDKNQALGQHGRTETRNNVDAIRGLKEDQIARTQQAVADGRALASASKERMAVRQAEIASDRQRKREDLFQRNLAKANELERRQFETSAIQKDKLVSMDRTRIQIRKEKARQYGEMIARTIERSVKSSSGSTLLTDASSEEFTLSDVKKGMKKAGKMAPSRFGKGKQQENRANTCDTLHLAEEAPKTKEKSLIFD